MISDRKGWSCTRLGESVSPLDNVIEVVERQQYASTKQRLLLVFGRHLSSVLAVCCPSNDEYHTTTDPVLLRRPLSSIPKTTAVDPLPVPASTLITPVESFGDCGVKMRRSGWRGLKRRPWQDDTSLLAPCTEALNLLACRYGSTSPSSAHASQPPR